MKKSLLVMLLALLSSFIFLGISQAGECTYLFSEKGKNYYYNSSDVEYSGDIVAVSLYEDSCSSPTHAYYLEIDCARRMISEYGGEWESISPGSNDDTTRIKLCR